MDALNSQRNSNLLPLLRLYLCRIDVLAAADHQEHVAH
jgi:hypothetical protein